MPNIRVKSLVYDRDQTFNALQNFLTCENGQVTIQDQAIYNGLIERDNLKTTVENLRTQIQDLQEKEVQLTGIHVEHEKLQHEQEKKQVEINNLKSLNQNLNNEIKELKGTIEDLTDENKKVLEENQVFQHKLNQKENIRKIFHKWGTYESIMKDIKIVKYFQEYPNKYVRAKTLIQHFRNDMEQSTLRNHVYSLLKKGILIESPEFRGSYMLNDHHPLSSDVYKLAEILLGSDLVSMAFESYSEGQQRNTG